MNLPDLAIINFSEIPEGDIRRAIRHVNRQVSDDFLPIWGSGYYCKLHRRDTPVPTMDAHTGRHPRPDIIQSNPVQGEAAIFLVDRPHISSALSYCSMNTAEIPVAFVFTDLGDWTVTLSHEVLEMIVDSTLGFFLADEPNRA